MFMNVSFGIMILRVVAGLLFAGHGAQKLLGWFGGKGLAGHAAVMKHLGLQPPALWAAISALGEFLGGLGLAAGLLTPLAAAALVGSMLVAILKVHGPKGLWNSRGGFEFPLVMGTVAFVVGLTGPGSYSLDSLLGLQLPDPLAYALALFAMLVVVVAALVSVPAQRQEHHTT
jgi:putative oxidoreductase